MSSTKFEELSFSEENEAMNAGTMVVVNLNMKREAGRIPGLNGVLL